MQIIGGGRSLLRDQLSALWSENNQSPCLSPYIDALPQKVPDKAKQTEGKQIEQKMPPEPQLVEL